MSAKARSAPTSSSPRFPSRCCSAAELGDGDRVASLLRFAGAGAADVGASGEVLADRGFQGARAVAVEDVDLFGSLAQAAVQLLLQRVDRLVDPHPAQIEGGLR